MATALAEKYGWQTAQEEESHSYLVPAALDYMKLAGGKNLVDIGVGNGSLLPVWHKAGYNITAFEPDTEGFNFSRKHQFADVRQLGLGDAMPDEWLQAFDLAVCLEVVEHLFDPALLPATAKQLLKPGGIIVVSTPYHGYFKNIALALLDKWDFHHHPNRIGGHIKFWSKNTLIKLFTDAGFELAGFKGAGRVPLLWKSMVLTFKIR